MLLIRPEKNYFRSNWDFLFSNNQYVIHEESSPLSKDSVIPSLGPRLWTKISRTPEFIYLSFSFLSGQSYNYVPTDNAVKFSFFFSYNSTLDFSNLLTLVHLSPILCSFLQYFHTVLKLIFYEDIFFSVTDMARVSIP